MKVKDVFGYKGLYKINEEGDIFSIKRGAKKSDQLTSRGYRGVCLYKDGKAKMHMVHRLVCQTFLENPKNKPIVNHKNGIKTDNYISNLEWCTYSENQTHSFQNGLWKSTDKHKRAVKKVANTILSKYRHLGGIKNRKVALNKVEKIKEMYKKGIKQINIAKTFNLSKQTVNQIIRGKSYRGVLSEG